jgi:hypothetical protein
MNSSHSRFVDVLLRGDYGALNVIDSVLFRLPRKADSAHRAVARMHGDLTASLILFAAAQREKSLAQHFKRMAPAAAQTIGWHISPGKGFRGRAPVLFAIASAFDACPLSGEGQSDLVDIASGQL